MPLEFYSEAELKHQARQERRRRLLQGVRGWLYETRSPRWLTTGLLAVSLLAGAGVACAASQSGLRSIPWLCFIGIVAAWPVFLSLVRWQAGRMIRCLEALHDGRSYLARDIQAERDDFFDIGFWDRTENRQAFAESFQREAASFGGRLISTPFGPFVLLGLGVATLGMWLLWDLVKNGPTLLAEAFVDDAFPRRHPQFAEPMHTEPWLPNAVIATCVHFVGFAFCASGIALAIMLFRPPPIAG